MTKNKEVIIIKKTVREHMLDKICVDLYNFRDKLRTLGFKQDLYNDDIYKFGNIIVHFWLYEFSMCNNNKQWVHFREEDMNNVLLDDAIQYLREETYKAIEHPNGTSSALKILKKWFCGN